MSTPRTRPTAAQFIAPIDRARDLKPLASVFRALGTRERLVALQMLVGGPMRSRDLPVRIDELHLLEDVGVLVSSRADGRQLEWHLRPDVLQRVGDCLRISDQQVPAGKAPH